MPYDQSLEGLLRAFEAQVQATPGVLTSDEAKDMLVRLGEKISTGTSSPDRVRALEAIGAAGAYLEEPNPPITPRNLLMILSVLRYDKIGVSESLRLQLQVSKLASEALKRCGEFEATSHSPEEKQKFYSGVLDSIEAKVKDAVAKGQMTQKHAKNIFAAIEFYRKKVHIQPWQSGPSSIIGEVLAIDFTQHVEPVTCHTSSTLYQLQKPAHSSAVGAFYTATPPVTVFGRAAVSGISAGAACDTGHDARHTATETHAAPTAGVKSVYVSTCECPVLGLSSRAAPTVDTWSSPGQESPVAGGGSQIRIADDARSHIRRTGILRVDRWGRPLDRPPMVRSERTADQLPPRPEAALPSWLQSAPSPPKVPTRQPVTPMGPHAQALLDALTPGSTPSRPVSAGRRKTLNNGLGRYHI